MIPINKSSIPLSNKSLLRSKTANPKSLKQSPTHHDPTIEDLRADFERQNLPKTRMKFQAYLNKLIQKDQNIEQSRLKQQQMKNRFQILKEKMKILETTCQWKTAENLELKTRSQLLNLENQKLKLENQNLKTKNQELKLDSVKLEVLKYRFTALLDETKEMEIVFGASTRNRKTDFDKYDRQIREIIRASESARSCMNLFQKEDFSDIQLGTNMESICSQIGNIDLTQMIHDPNAKNNFQLNKNNRRYEKRFENNHESSTKGAKDKRNFVGRFNDHRNLFESDSFAQGHTNSQNVTNLRHTIPDFKIAKRPNMNRNSDVRARNREQDSDFFVGDLDEYAFSNNRNIRRTSDSYSDDDMY